MPTNDLIGIYLSNDKDIIVISKSGKVYALSSDSLQIIDECNLGIKPSTEPIIEAYLDNT